MLGIDPDALAGEIRVKKGRIGAYGVPGQIVVFNVVFFAVGHIEDLQAFFLLFDGIQLHGA